MLSKLSLLFQNWAFHNLFAHPVHEVVFWLVRPFGWTRADAVSRWIHDSTLPPQVEGEGRS